MLASKSKMTIRLFIIGLFIAPASWGQASVPINTSIDVLIPQVEQASLKILDKPIQIKLEQYGTTTPWTFIHLHDSEPSSLEATRKILPITGGQLIKIVNKGQRNLSFTHRKKQWKIDPNRIFSDTGIHQNLLELQKWQKDGKMVASIQTFGTNLLNLIPKKTNCLISLHNNTDGNFSILDYLPDGIRAGDAKKVFVDSLQDPDDLVLCTDSLVYEHMSAGCYNVIWQDPETVRKDGSLSVYCGLRNIRYVNIETQHGSVDQYRRMLQHLMLLLTKSHTSSSATTTDPALISPTSQ